MQDTWQADTGKTLQGLAAAVHRTYEYQLAWVRQCPCVQTAWPSGERSALQYTAHSGDVPPLPQLPGIRGVRS